MEEQPEPEPTTRKLTNDPSNYFIYAIQYGNDKIVQEMMNDSRVKANVKDNMAIEIAMNKYNLKGDESWGKIIELLLNDKKKSRVDPSVSNNDPLRSACENGWEKIVKMLLDDERVNPTEKENEAIRKAAKNGHVKVVELLLKDKRIDPCAKDNYALKWSVDNGHDKIVELLLNDSRIILNDKIIIQMIKCSCENGFEKIIQILLRDERVNPSIDNNIGFIVALKYNYENIAKLFLYNKRFDPSIGNNCLIRWVAEHGYDKFVSLLMEDKRVDPSASDNVAIGWASENGHDLVVRLLLKDKRVDPTDNNFYSLLAALKNGRKNIVFTLLQDKRIELSSVITFLFYFLTSLDDKLLSNHKELRTLIMRLLLDENDFQEVLFSGCIKKFKSLMINDESLKSLYKKYKGYVYKGNQNGVGIIYQKKRAMREKKKKLLVVYIGKFKNGKKHGIGRLFSTTRQRTLFFGNFSNDKKNGFGIEYDDNSCIVKKGEWKDDVFIKKHVTQSISQYNLDEFKKKVWNSPYRNIYKLGEGSLSEVYICDDIYAFKHINVQNFNKKYVEKEFQILSNMSHQNIINILGVSIERDLVGFICDLCDKSIDFLITDSMRRNEGKKGRKSKKITNGIPQNHYYISFQEKIRIIYSICLGLEYLHANSIVHRDLRTDNIYLTHPPQKVVKLGEYGMQKLSELTSHTGGFIGSPGFISPEIIRSTFDPESYTFSSDVFALGMVLYELLFERTIERSINEKRKQSDKIYGIQISNLMSNKKNPLRPPIDENLVNEKNEWAVKLIRMCWEENENKRPKVTKILQIIVENVTDKPYSKYVFQERVFDKVTLNKSVKNLSDDGTNEIMKLKLIIEEKDKIIDNCKLEIENLKTENQKLIKIQSK